MNIKGMLVRLQGALGQNDLVEKMVLLPGLNSTLSNWHQSTEAINIVVGYSGSLNSQIALDLTLWIAHQTRLATGKRTTVQVVYVVGNNPRSHCSTSLHPADVSSGQSMTQKFGELSQQFEFEFQRPALTQQRRHALTASPLITSEPDPFSTSGLYPIDSFERADRILWQARSLAEEWRGSLETHLRFGDISQELRSVVEAEAAALLFLGCYSVNHPVVQSLDPNFPCAVLGIPDLLRLETTASGMG